MSRTVFLFFFSARGGSYPSCTFFGPKGGQNSFFCSNRFYFFSDEWGSHRPSIIFPHPVIAWNINIEPWIGRGIKCCDVLARASYAPWNFLPLCTSHHKKCIFQRRNPPAGSNPYFFLKELRITPFSFFYL